MSATDPRTTHVPVCSECGKQPKLEKRELIGLVVCCDCTTMSIRVNTRLAEEWQ